MPRLTVAALVVGLALMAQGPGWAGWMRFIRSEPVARQPVIADAVTQLAWQGCTAGMEGTACEIGQAAVYDWAAGGDYCQDLEWGGLDDWRLPGLKEIDSLIDSQRRSPAIDPVFFPATPTGWFWSSTSYAADPLYAWHANFGTGHLGNFDKAFLCFVRCVRDGR
jgi:hypothetical protein